MSEMARGVLCGCEGDDVSTRLVPLHCLTTNIDMGVFERLWVDGFRQKGCLLSYQNVQ